MILSISPFDFALILLSADTYEANFIFFFCNLIYTFLIFQPYCHILGGQIPITNNKTEERNYAFKLEELIGIIASLFGIVLIVLLWVMCRKFKVVKATRNANENTGNATNPTGNGRGSYHIQNDFDKESIQMRHPESKLNNLDSDLYVQR